MALVDSSVQLVMDLGAAFLGYVALGLGAVFLGLSVLAIGLAPVLRRQRVWGRETLLPWSYLSHLRRSGRYNYDIVFRCER